jgi:hypothetical protein
MYNGREEDRSNRNIVFLYFNDIYYYINVISMLNAKYIYFCASFCA